MNLNKHSKVRAVGLSSSFALLALLGLAVFCPATSEGANAADSSSATFELDFVLDRNNTRAQVTQALGQDVALFGNDGISTTAADDITKSATFVVDFLLAPKLSISLDNLPTTVAQSVQPTASGQTVSQATSFTASTNSSSGLGVFVYGTNGTDLVGTDAANKIPTLTANASGLSAIPVNQWGYNVTAGTSAPAAANLTYKPLSATKGNAETSTSASTTNQSYYITFGAKVDYNKAPDTYSNTVTVHVVPNATSTTAANEMGRVADPIIAESQTNASEAEEVAE